jgi:putative ABC transport system permease protein
VSDFGFHEVLMSYALATLWYERQRFLPGVLAVAFSALLIALQCGLLLGLFSITSLPIDEARADVWVGHPGLQSVDLGQPIPAEWLGYLAMPEVVQTEVTIQGFAYWQKPTGGRELCLIIGTRLGPDSLGAVKNLTPGDRAYLTEEGAIVIDDSEFARLGISKIDDTAEVSGERVVVRGTVHGYKSLAGPFIFCSVYTAQRLLHTSEDQATFLLAKCRRPEDAARVVERLRAYPRQLAPFTRDEFSLHSRMHWLTKTKAGIALGLAALLGLLVGAVVTSQTLYAATVASLREYAVLRAMGIPRWRMALMVLAQSFWIGAAGVALALPAVYGLAYLGNQVGAKVLLPWWQPPVLGGAVSVTMLMAMLSGLTALRSLRLIEPVSLLR